MDDEDDDDDDDENDEEGLLLPGVMLWPPPGLDVWQQVQ